MKLDKYVLDRRIKLMEEEGIKFITNTEIGKDVNADLLLKENDAVAICTGSTTPRDIKIPNRDSKGICFAMTYLEKSQRRRAGDDVPWEGLDPAGKRIIILGGGGKLFFNESGCNPMKNEYSLVNQSVEIF